MSEDRPDTGATIAEISGELEECVLRAVAEQMCPIREHMAQTSRAMSVLADRIHADELRQSMTAAIEQAVLWIESALTADSARLSEQLSAIEGPLIQGAAERRAEIEDLRRAFATTIDVVERRIESARVGDTQRVLDQLNHLGGQLENLSRPFAHEPLTHQAIATTAEEVSGRSESVAADSVEQGRQLLAALDDRLHAILVAANKAGEADAARLVTGLADALAAQERSLRAHIDERTTVLNELGSFPRHLIDEVSAGAVGAVDRQVGPLVSRLVEAVDTLAHAEGRFEALSRGQAGEARAVEERVAAMLTEIIERAETAVDRSRSRVAEGQVALGTRFESVASDLLSGVQATTNAIEARMTETVAQVGVAAAHHNGALLDAIARSGQELAAGGRLDAIAGGFTTGQREQLAAIESLSARLDEVGPLVARALLSEVERAARSAGAAEEAVAMLRPEALRRTLVDAGERSTAELRAAIERIDETVTALAAGATERLAAVEAGQAGIRAELVALDVRGLRDRLVPHLVALAEATTRRAEADSAGFDAVLARIDQLIAIKDSRQIRTE